ncbi:hypothetical protein SUDANB120_05416 [Streptomyces sp. enrichment culture]
MQEPTSPGPPTVTGGDGIVHTGQLVAHAQCDLGTGGHTGRGSPGTVAQHGHAFAVPCQTGVPPRPRVRGIAGHRACGGDHEFRVRVDDDLYVRREPVVAQGRSDLPVADRDGVPSRRPEVLSARSRAAAAAAGSPGRPSPARIRTAARAAPRSGSCGSGRATSSTRSASGRHYGRPPPGPFPPRSRTTFGNRSNCRIRSPVNVSTHNGSALNAPAIQGNVLIAAAPSSGGSPAASDPRRRCRPDSRRHRQRWHMGLRHRRQSDAPTNSATVSAPAQTHPGVQQSLHSDPAVSRTAAPALPAHG